MIYWLKATGAPNKLLIMYGLLSSFSWTIRARIPKSYYKDINSITIITNINNE